MSYIQTEYWTVDKDKDIDKLGKEIKEAALWIKKGELVAFPTETVYGLGANALDEEAVKKIFIAKGRPSDNPLIVHIAELDQLDALVSEVPSHAKKLMEHFWPGPLTIIFNRTDAAASSVTAHLPTIAVRMPSHPVALALLKAAKVPVAAPSANVSGKPSPTSADHVYHDLNGKIAGIVDGGPTGLGLESTVLDCSRQVPVLYRPGGITKEEIERVIGPIQVESTLKSKDEAPASPGLKYTHYAPSGTLFLVSERERIKDLVNVARKSGKRVGVLATEESSADYEADVTVVCGRRSDLGTVAGGLYEALRTFDREGAELIYAEVFPEEGLGVAIMNRLTKAAGGKQL